MKYSFCIVFLCLLQFNSFAETLFLSYQIEKDQIIAIGILNEQTLKISTPSKSVLDYTQTAYKIVEDKQHKRKSTFEVAINELSETLLFPFEDLLKECDKVQITLDGKLLKIPFEYFKINEFELAIYKPLVFRLFGNEFPEFSKPIILNSGTIIRTRNCDPQNACKTIKKSNPNFTSHSSKAINPNQLGNKNEDLLLISAHGHAYEKNRGFLGWNHILFEKEQLKKMNPKLTYFDSCQQGINLNYLEALQEAKGLNYYISPIISNDSGDSSTKTIESFFDFLKEKKNPIIALFETKNRLNQHYKRKKKITRYDKAFSFRIYEL